MKGWMLSLLSPSVTWLAGKAIPCVSNATHKPTFFTVDQTFADATLYAECWCVNVCVHSRVNAYQNLSFPNMQHLFQRCPLKMSMMCWPVDVNRFLSSTSSFRSSSNSFMTLCLSLHLVKWSSSICLRCTPSTVPAIPPSPALPLLFHWLRHLCSHML